MVSISCITYNHAPYIRECLDGFLMQKCDFEFEVLIHDDASTDGTQEVIKEYQEKYPDVIKPIFQTENQWSKGVRGMMARFNFPRAKGKYIALCEGDDYWTDPLKLKRQVDFLEENISYSMVTENSEILDQINNLNYNFSSTKERKDFVTIDLVKGRKFHTASVMFRKDLLDLPKNFGDFPFGDTLIFIALSRKGKTHFSPNFSSIYRKNEGGVSMEKNRYDWAQKVEKFNILLNEYLNYEYNTTLNRNIYLNYKTAFKWSLKNKKFIIALNSLYKYLQYKMK